MTEHATGRSAAGFTVVVSDEPVVEVGAHDVLPPYARVISLGESRTLSLRFRHGVRSLRGDQLVNSLLLESAGPSGVHNRSLLIVGDTCYVAVGPDIVALSTPTLEVVWSRRVDDAQCFGIHPGPDGNSLISHGELEIARVSLSGEILWQTGGADVFAGPLNVSSKQVTVRDFNGAVYRIDMETGQSTGGPS
jgi:outer membrane protein assembly factor BamB